MTCRSRRRSPGRPTSSRWCREALASRGRACCHLMQSCSGRRQSSTRASAWPFSWARAHAPWPTKSSKSRELLGAGVAKALLGKDVLPDDLPYVTGSIGLLGTRPSYELMRDCDTLLVIGSSFPYTQFMPEFGQARAVQIDSDPFMIGLRYPFEVNLVGDAAGTLKRLLPMLKAKKHGDWRRTVEKNTARWWEVMERRAAVDADPVNP